MGYLNKQERDQLLDEIKNLSFNRIRRKLIHYDQNVRLAFFRNSQRVNRLMTRYVLQDKGIQVTLIETFDMRNRKAEYELIEIVVEPTADNST